MLPFLYSAHHSLYTEDLPFWISLAEQQGSPILELGCGTGRVLGHLASAGYLTYGLDNHLDMLSYLTSAMPTQVAFPPRIFQANMAAFRLSIQFPLIILPCNTLSTLVEDARLATLRHVRAHLQPGGLFAASVPNPALLSILPFQGEAEIEEVFPHPISGNPVQVSSSWERTSHYFTVQWFYDHLLPDGQVERLTAEVQHAMVPVSAYLDELSSAGLHLVNCYGDFDRSEYTPESPSWIVIADNKKS